MRNWLLLLFTSSLLACSRDNDPDPTPPPPPAPVSEDWQLIDTKLSDNFADIAFVNPAVGFLAGGQGTYKSIDSGKTWATETNISSRPVTINFLNNQYGYAVGSTGVMNFTRNGGTNWQTKNVDLASDVCFVSPSTGYVTSRSGLLKTVDSGNTWLKVAGSQNSFSLSVYFINEQQGWFAQGDTLYQTLNGGNSWAGKKMYGSLIHTVFFTDINNGWFTADSSVYRTVNGGTTWTKTSVPGQTFDVQFLNSQRGFVTSHTGVFKTSDGGTTWVRSLTANMGGFPEILFLDQNTGWVTSNGNVIYRWKK